MRMIEFGGEQYHVTFSTDFDVHGDMVESRQMADPSAQVLVRVTGWNDEDDLRLNVTVASGVERSSVSSPSNTRRNRSARIWSDLEVPPTGQAISSNRAGLRCVYQT